MTTQARVGVFTLLALAGIFAVYYFVSSFALRHSGYQIGVRFHDVGGLQEGSSVLLSGVQVGEVTAVRLLPDQTVDVDCTINAGNTIYRDSVFMVAITFTGQTTLTITPPAVKLVAMAMPLNHELPENQQPWGGLPPTLTDLVSAGQVQMKNLDKTLAVVNKNLPALMRRFTDVANDSDRLIVHTDSTLAQLSGQITTTIAMLNTAVETSGQNISELTGNLNTIVGGNKGRIATLVDNLSKTAANLNQTMSGIRSIAQDPVLHSSLVGAAANVQEATAKLKAIASEIEGITGDPKTQTQLKGAINNLSDAAAKADDILGTFSSASRTTSPSASAPPQASGAPPQASGAPPAPMRNTGHPGILSQALVQAQIRETWGNRGGGPASDMNVVILPGSRTHLTLGANDLGYNTSYNFLVQSGATQTLQVSGGVLYSKLGFAALFRPFGSPIGVDARLYDPKHPTLDLYGDLRLTERLRLFYGERSIWGTAQKTPSFGIQVNY